MVNLKWLLAAAGAALVCANAAAQDATPKKEVTSTQNVTFTQDMPSAQEAPAQNLTSGPMDFSYRYPVWVNAGLFSYHADRNQGYRENNWGLGFETMFTREHGMVAGTFLNSEHSRSKYIGYQWRPLSWSMGDGWSVAAGLSVNAIDGYPGTNNRGWFIAPLPILALEYKNFGVNFVAIPHKNGGAVAAQLKLRVW